MQGVRTDIRQAVKKSCKGDPGEAPEEDPENAGDEESVTKRFHQILGTQSPGKYAAQGHNAYRYQKSGAREDAVANQLLLHGQAPATSA